MGRWLLPATLFACAAWLYWQNHGGAVEGRYAVLPFVESLFPETSGDPPAMAARSEQLAFGVAAVAAVLTAIESIVRTILRARRKNDDEA